jgi:outer membrane protein
MSYADPSTTETQPLNLQKCIELALQNNDRSKISKDAVEMALAVHGQALSSWWPQIAGSVSGSRMDEPLNFIFPSSQITVPAGTLTVTPSPITLPANLFGPGFPPDNITMPMQPTTINIPAQVMQVPEQNVKIMNRDSLTASVNFTFPLYTGGLRSARIKQAKAGVEAARQDERRTTMEVIYDVKRLYYAVILSRQMLNISKDTLTRMETTLDLTEKMFQTGSGTVKKTDYLRNKYVVETIRGVVSEINSQAKVMEATLLMTMGLDMDKSITLSDAELPFSPQTPDISSSVRIALSNNPDLAKVEAAITAARFGVKAAQSGHLPKVALLGKAYRISNAYDAGFVSEDNKSGWMVGLGVEIPIFEGFRVTHEVAEQQANLRKLEHQRDLLRQGIALQVHNACFDLIKALEKQKSGWDALKSATENRELNLRAYQEELVETKEVIEAQIYEALLSGQYQKVLYDYLEAQAHLSFISGSHKSATN